MLADVLYIEQVLNLFQHVWLEIALLYYVIFSIIIGG